VLLCHRSGIEGEDEGMSFPFSIFHFLSTTAIQIQIQIQIQAFPLAHTSSYFFHSYSEQSRAEQSGQ
jgi:hypothetical protein